MTDSELRELDARIAEKVMGNAVRHSFNFGDTCLRCGMHRGWEMDGPVRCVPHYSTNPADSKLLLMKLRELGYEIHTEVYPVSVMEDPRSKYFDHSGVPFYVKLIRRVGVFASWETRADTPEQALALCADRIGGRE